MEDHSFKDRDGLVEDLLKMLERGSRNEVRIKLSDGEIVANTDILVARSDYFATMFSNDKFIEGKTRSVDMRHCSKAIMEKIIKFLFSGEVTFSDLSFAQLLEMSHMSNMMLLSKFNAQLFDYVSRVIVFNSRGNVKFLPELISGLKLANQYNLSSLKPWIAMELYFGLKVIPNDVECSDSFKSLAFNLIQEIFLCDTFNTLKDPPSSMQKTEAFILWLSKNDVTDKQKNEIVDSIDFKDFTVENLMTSVRKSGLYPANQIDERVLDLFNDQNQLVQRQHILLKEKDNLLGLKEREIRQLNQRLQIGRISFLRNSS